MLYSASTGGFYHQAIHGEKIPADAVNITQEDYAALLNGQSSGKRIVADENGWPVLADPPPLSQDQIIAGFVAAAQKRLDDFARTRNYDGILSAATYATSTVPKFAAEGQYAVQARDATWATLYQILAEVQAETRPAPASFAEIEPELPALAWPGPTP